MNQPGCGLGLGRWMRPQTAATDNGSGQALLVQLHSVEGATGQGIAGPPTGPHPGPQDDDHIRSLGAVYLAEAVNLYPEPGEQDHAQQGQYPHPTQSQP
jgi:hypothetical protein